jgi:hypothetical protein
MYVLCVAKLNAKTYLMKLVSTFSTRHAPLKVIAITPTTDLRHTTKWPVRTNWENFKG